MFNPLEHSQITLGQSMQVSESLTYVITKENNFFVLVLEKWILFNNNLRAFCYKIKSLEYVSIFDR